MTQSPLNSFDFDKIYCISLESKPERRENARAQFESVDLKNWEFFNAIVGDGRYVSKSGRFTPGMIGCYKSHQVIWKEALDKGYERILVFEDDLRFVDNFNLHLLACLPSIPADWELVWWGYTEIEGKVKSYVNDWWAIPSDTWGTHAYMLQGKDTIAKFYEGSLHMAHQIDGQMSRHIIHHYNIKAYSAWPRLVRQRKELGTDCQFKK